MKQGVNGQQAARDNVVKFENYWKGLREADRYLPLKEDGTVWVDKVAADADIGKSALRQNPVVKERYEAAVSETLEAHRKAIEARLASRVDAETSPPHSAEEAGSAADKDEIKRLKKRVQELQQKLGGIEVAYDNALERISELEKVERDYNRLKLLAATFEFQAEFGVNPGPY